LRVAAIALSVFLLAVTVSFLMPRQYESTARVRVVDNPALYELYGRSLGGAKGDERIRAIPQEILSPSLIAEVIEDLELDEGLGGLPERERTEQREALARGIQEGTKVGLAEKPRAQHIFEISHTCADPVLAQRIVMGLSTGYQSRHCAEKNSTAADALESLRRKAVEVHDEYETVNAALAAFEKEHESYRFGQEDDTRTRLSEEREKLDGVALEIQEIELRLANIREQMADEEEWITVEREVDNAASIEAIEKEIQAAEQVLLGYQLKYTDAHPKVVIQKEKIEHLKKKLEAETAKVRKVTKKERNPTWVELKKSEVEAITNLTVKREIIAEYERRVTDLEARMQAYPALKKEWEGIVEKRDALKDERVRLGEQEEAALLAWQTKVAEGAMIFSVVEPPTVPLRPKSPNQALLALAGLVLGLAAGASVVLVRDFFDRSFRDAEDFTARLAVPVLGSIPVIETAAEREAARRKKRVALAAVVALLVAAVGVVFAQAQFEGEINSFVRETVNRFK
jgi:polysaccharide chain length determinant protein (PEP-CTERM system associated)